MVNDPTKNHGEGNPEAAARFNDAETAFIESAKGQAAVKAGPRVNSKEQPELDEAERLGRAKARGATPPADGDPMLPGIDPQGEAP
jgi:hypothetical protein